MTLAELIGRVRISHIYAAMGGPAVSRGMRTRSIIGREGDNPSALVLDDQKNVFFDHVLGRGGGVLDLIQLVRGGTRVEAAEWLADFANTSLESSGPQRNMAQVEAEAMAFVHWRRDRLSHMLCIMTVHRSAYFRAVRKILIHSLDHPRANFWMDVAESSEKEWAHYQGIIERLRTAPATELLDQFRRERAA